MPRLDQDNGMETIKMGGNFTFQGARIERLGATEYTLVTIAVDETGSVMGFKQDLENALITAVESCKKSPRSDNLLIRVITFSDRHPSGVNELHGFKPLTEINPIKEYRKINPGGMTPLFDACFSAVGAMNVYGQQLADQDFGVNAIAFIITDGDDNASITTPKMIKEEIAKATREEYLESIITVLIGINTKSAASYLADFQQKADLTQFIDAGDVTPQKLAKLANFVSQSVSSQSQALGTGGPSKNVSATI